MKVQSNLDYPYSLRPDEIVRIIEDLDNRKYEYQWRTKLIELRKRHLIVKQHFCKLFGGLEIGVPDVRCWINPAYRALSNSSSCAIFRDFCFSPSLVSKMSANFMLVSLFLRISEICCLLTPYSADKLVPFSPFSYQTIIDCLSFIEKTDCLRFKDVMIVNKRSRR